MISLLSKHIFILCGGTSFTVIYIVPLSSPRKTTRLYINIWTTDFVKLMCHAREVFPGKGFSSGPSIAEKWGLEIF